MQTIIVIEEPVQHIFPRRYYLREMGPRGGGLAQLQALMERLDALSSFPDQLLAHMARARNAMLRQLSDDLGPQLLADQASMPQLAPCGCHVLCASAWAHGHP